MARSPFAFLILFGVISFVLLAKGWPLTGALLIIAAPNLSNYFMKKLAGSRTTAQESVTVADSSSRPFEPSPADVFVVRAMLAKARPALPPELVDIIIELSEYWPCSRTVRDYRDSSRGQIQRTSRAVTSNSGGRSDNTVGNRSTAGNEFLIRAPPIGLRKPPCPDFTTTEHVPLSDIEEEATSEYFKRYLKASMPTLAHPVRKIVFTTTSRDQGWASQATNTYKASWTWFEAGLERLDTKEKCPHENEEKNECSHFGLDRDKAFFPYCKLKPVRPRMEAEPPPGHVRLYHDLHPDDKYTIQRNFVGSRTPRTHTVVWSCDDNGPLESDELVDIGRGKNSGTGEFVRDLKVGDVVGIWAKARYPGWVNYVDKVEMEIYWAV